MKHSFFESLQAPFSFVPYANEQDDRDLSLLRWTAHPALLYIISGTAVYLDNGEAYKVCKNDFLCIAPGHVYGLVEKSRDFNFHLLSIQESFCRENGLPLEEMIPEPRFSDEEAVRLFRRFMSEYEAPISLLKQATMNTLVMALLVLILRKHALDGKREREESTQRVKDAILYMEEEYAKDISLDSVAEHIHISKFYLAHEFKKITGRTFLSYLNTIRCHRAKELLLAGGNVADVGKACGLANRSHFAKTFEKYEGMLPGDVKPKKKKR